MLIIETDGTIAPFEALTKASSILESFFGRISSGIEEVGGEEGVKDEDKPSTVKREDVYLEELPLPTRTVNALKKAGIKTLSDLSQTMPEELSEVKNLGDKSIEEINKLLKKEGLR